MKITWKLPALVFSALLVLHCGSGNGSGDDTKVSPDVELPETAEDSKDPPKPDVEQICTPGELDGCMDTRIHDVAMQESDFPAGLQVVRVVPEIRWIPKLQSSRLY